VGIKNGIRKVLWKCQIRKERKDYFVSEIAGTDIRKQL
jgi:hypothetical protein